MLIILDENRRNDENTQKLSSLVFIQVIVLGLNYPLMWKNFRS